MELTGLTALVTGAGQRIGAACIQALADKGVRIACHANHSWQSAQGQCDDIRRQGGTAELFVADLAQEEASQRLFEQVTERMGGVQILVNNAAIFQRGTLLDLQPSQWQRMMAINLTAPMLLMQSFARQGQAGTIVNVLDQRIARPRPGHLAYTVAKSALWTLTQMAALELAPAIRVNAIAPGPILPAMGDSDAAFQRVVAATPLQRAGSPQDVVQALLFLLQQPFITGQLLFVDGGEHL
ncbi:MAG: SDR family oxidoreductase [Magnetococcales bacterium]|nr:SDR family oxidoreductase [Magnetococcales bacterium]MBF0115117.1 SDR family oxidoreductase [Magnetococcales bacterium]